ncbi:salicylate hydroxylase [Enemella evansiae]|uniref:FAD-dependent monooxygenase n=1 Tax=Enemella evansiae TaxID=2016499 RepID=UPI000B97B73F|nr:FAD-dependent monooxygenase [Enemella evansiae]OYO09830.1 salicylate hydroxylase [Enemella evansiae]
MRIAINGAGIGGLTLALALDRLGLTSTVFEQARAFTRVGADINLTPNAVRALDQLGIGEQLRQTAAGPAFRISRDGRTGEETSRLPMSEAAEQTYGAPQLTLHRGDLMTVLEDAVGASGSTEISLGHRLVDLRSQDSLQTLDFADGSSAEADVTVGADGIHSAVRTALLGAEHPTFTGVVAYRAVVPIDRLAGLPDLDCFTKWWGTDPAVQIVTFPLGRGELFIFATVPRSSWSEESWTTPGRIEELREAYAAFHPQARALLDACDEVLISALHVRDPLPCWGTERVTLLGDAAHPMMPFMAQGAGQAIEDAVVLARTLARFEPAEALHRYQAARRERTARIQLGSRGNAWLREGGNADWVYGYDAWEVAV